MSKNINLRETVEYKEHGFKIVTCPICGEETLDSHLFVPIVVGSMMALHTRWKSLLQMAIYALKNIKSVTALNLEEYPSR